MIGNEVQIAVIKPVISRGPENTPGPRDPRDLVLHKDSNRQKFDMNISYEVSPVERRRDQGRPSFLKCLDTKPVFF